MYEENIRNLVAQRERESAQAMLCQSMSKKALQRINMNKSKGLTHKHTLNKKQKKQIQSVNIYIKLFYLSKI